MKSKQTAMTRRSGEGGEALVRFEEARNDILDGCVSLHHTVHGVEGGHTNRAIAGAFTPDGKGLLTGSWDGLGILWDLETGLPMTRFVGHEDHIQALCLAPDGKLMVTGSDDCTVRSWDVASGKCLHVFRGHKAGVDCVCVTPDGEEVISGGRDTTAIVWSVRTRRLVRVLEGHADNVSSVCVNRDGSLIVTGSYDGDIRIWDRASGRLVRVLPERRCVNCVSITHDGHIVAAYATNDCRLWSLEGECLRVIRKHTSAMLRIADERDDSAGKTSHYINSSSVSGTATRLISATSCTCVTASTDRPYFFSTGWDKTCRQVSYDGNELRCFQGHEGPVSTVVISPDGRRIATGGWDSHCRVSNIETGKTENVLKGCTNPVNSLAVSPRGSELVTAGGHSAIVWDLNEGAPRFRLNAHTDRINAVTYSRDGRHILTAGSDGSVIAWSSETGARELLIEHGTAATGAMYSPDMRIIAVAGLSGRASVYDVNSHMPVQEFNEHWRGLSCISFTPDSRRIVVASGDRSACMYDIPTGRLILRFPHDDEVRAMAVTVDGTRMVTGCLNGELRVWDLHNGRMVTSIHAHQNGVNAVAVNRCGDRIISGGADHLVRVWKWEDGRCESIGREHTDQVTSIGVSPTGDRVFTGGADHVVRCWDFSWNNTTEGPDAPEDLPLLATMYNLERGFLWTTPPAKEENAESGWFWTDQPALLRVVSREQDSAEEKLLTDQDKDDYFAVFHRKDMVMARLASKNSHDRLNQQIRRRLASARGESIKRMEESLRRRLGPRTGSTTNH